jgi:hypothetical protein
MNAAELEGAELDAAVALAEGWIHCPPPFVPEGAPPYWWRSAGEGYHADRAGKNETPPPFSSDWSLGGPIVERERIAVAPYAGGWFAEVEPDRFYGRTLELDAVEVCPTPLVAAMRAYVASKAPPE